MEGFRLAAGAELVKNYEQPLQRAMRRVLGRSRRLRSLYDTVEFTQFAWQEFFRRRGEWSEIETPAQLLAVLLAMGQNHLRDQRRRFDRKLHGCRAVSLDDVAAEAVPDRGPLPGDLADVRDQLEAVLRRHPAHHRRIVELRGDGHTCEEIAELIGRSEGQVRRMLAKIEAELSG